MASELTEAEAAERKALKARAFMLSYTPPSAWSKADREVVIRFEELTAKAMSSSQGLLLTK